jgi:predicted secreted protein
MKFLKCSGQDPVHALRIAVLAIVGVILLAGGLQMFGNENTVRVTIKDSGSSVTLHSGQQLEVTLPASFGTGYSWKLAKTAESVLKAEGGPQTAPAENEPKAGGTEYQIFRFVTSAKGTGKLVLQYTRPWTKEKPAKEFSLTVQVQ